MAKTLEQKVRREFGRIFRRNEASSNVQDPSSFEEGWPEERSYWFNVLRDFYQSSYGVDVHPAQSDSSFVPPAETVISIQRANKADPDAFFASGYRNALDYQIELRDYGASVDGMESILEMGVGLGRLILQLFPFKANLYGCDVTPDAVAWTRSKLAPRVDVQLTGLEPPLPYADSMFDFVYANSVFTHVPCPFVDGWAAELQRILRPGGFLIFSVFDANHYFRDVSYREFHEQYALPGCHDWNHHRGVHMMTYLSREFILTTWGRYFRVLEIRSHYRDQSHVICQRMA